MEWNIAAEAISLVMIGIIGVYARKGSHLPTLKNRIFQWCLTVTFSAIFTNILSTIMIQPVSYTHLDVYKRQVRYLCAFKRSSFNNWTYVVNYSMDEIMRQVKSVTSTAMLIIMFAIAVEMVLVLLISYWIFKPFRMLFNNVRCV